MKQSTYCQVLLENASAVASLENSLKNATYLLPGRFKNAELAAESVYSLVSLFSMYNDSVLFNHIPKKYRRGDVTRKDDVAIFNKYTNAMLKSHPQYTFLAYALSITQSVEVLLEMLAHLVDGGASRQWGPIRWKMIIWIESIKTMMKSALFMSSCNRKLLQSPIPIRDYDMAHLPPLQDVNGKSSVLAANDEWKGSRTRKRLPTLQSLSHCQNSENFLLSKALTDSDMILTEPRDYCKPLTGRQKLGEWLFIFRPLLYILSLKRYGRSSWKPWLFSFLLELSSLSCSYTWQKKTGDIPDSPPTKSSFKPVSSTTVCEQNELKRRWWLLFYYLLRSPVYEAHVRSRLNAVIEKFSKYRILSLFAGKFVYTNSCLGVAQDYQSLWESYYFYIQ